MTAAPHRTLIGASPLGESPAPLAPGAHRSLLAVCAGLAVLAALLVPLTLPLGWDELVYASRFPSWDPGTPFSSPRTRGVPLLLTPVAAWSDSVLLLRVWLTLLASLALYLGFRPWLRLLHRPAAVPLAAAGYGTLWVSLFYTGSAMPNHYTAMGALAAVGYFVSRRPSPAGIALGLAIATLMRPNDGAWVAAPLLVAAVLVPAWRRRTALVGVFAGIGAGALPWVVEAYVRFDGVLDRLSDASDVQGGMRPVLSLAEHAIALDGPLLCRPCVGYSLNPLALELWVLLLAFGSVGLWALRRSAQDSRTLWLAVAVALSSAAPYFFLVDYAAPRFLLPTYALLMLPAALGVLAAWDAATRGDRRLPRIALALVLLAHLAFQLPLARTHADIQQGARTDWVRIAQLLEDHGVRPPCTLKATARAIPLGHTADCVALEPDDPTVPDALVYRHRPPAWAANWPSQAVPEVYAPGWYVAIRPARGG